MSPSGTEKTIGSRSPKSITPGDSAHIDEDGYVWFGGRADEIIKIAGHRIGTIEVESAFLTHPSVAECGVVGRPDEIRGEIISAFIVLRHGHEPSDELRSTLVEVVRNELGPIAVIGELNFVTQLPKTRSGKIMRRVLRAVTAGIRPGRHHDHRGGGLCRRGTSSLGANEGRDRGKVGGRVGIGIRGRRMIFLVKPPVARGV